MLVALLSLRTESWKQTIRKIWKKATDRNASSSTTWCTIYKTQKPSMSYSAWIDMHRVGLSYLSKSCTPPAFNILYIQSGGGCYTADACQRETSRVMMPAAFLSLLTADLVALASETRISMCGVAGIVS